MNVTDPAAPGLEFNTTDYDPNLVVDQPETYLFWDDVHPTTAAHSLLAEFAFDVVTFSADFDFDGDVDHDDLTNPALGWQARYGNDLDGLNFLQWQQQFDSGATPLGPLSTNVPEPSTATAFVLFVGCFLVGPRTQR